MGLLRSYLAVGLLLCVWHVRSSIQFCDFRNSVKRSASKTLLDTLGVLFGLPLDSYSYNLSLSLESQYR